MSRHGAFDHTTVRERIASFVTRLPPLKTLPVRSCARIAGQMARRVGGIEDLAICLELQKFTDGRACSNASKPGRRYNCAKGLRATGNVLRVPLAGSTHSRIRSAPNGRHLPTVEGSRDGHAV